VSNVIATQFVTVSEIAATLRCEESRVLQVIRTSKLGIYLRHRKRIVSESGECRVAVEVAADLLFLVERNLKKK